MVGMASAPELIQRIQPVAGLTQAGVVQKLHILRQKLYTLLVSVAAVQVGRVPTKRGHITGSQRPQW